MTVNTTGGSPTLTLNDGGTATYTGGSGTSALTFSYTVGAGQNTAALAATTVNLNGGTIKDGAGNAGQPVADRSDPDRAADRHHAADGIVGDGDRGRLRCRQGADADAQYERGGERDRHADADAQRWRHCQLCQRLRLQCAGVQLHGWGRAEHRCAAVTGVTGTITDLAGNALSTAGLPETFTGVIVDTTTPTISAIAESPSSGDLNAGKTVTFTLTTTEAVTVNTTGGTPTLTLNDGSTATYSGGSGTTALTFSYTVGAGQNIAALARLRSTSTAAPSRMAPAMPPACR